MNLRHTAAFALVGWYLIVPPNVDKPDAPLSTWNTIKVFDTAVECRDARSKWEIDSVDIVEQNVKRYGHLQEDDKRQLAQGHAARCIATDDPRLKNK